MDTKQVTAFDRSCDPSFFAYYAEQSESAGTRQRFAQVLEKAMKLIASRRADVSALDVLDIGCNAGTQSRMWARLGHRVTGLDVNEPLLELARERARADHLTIRFDVASATALPYRDSTFDVCLLPELLEHVEDWETCLREAVRVLKPNGVFFVSTTNALCPKQQEYNLPLYSWYPGFAKRWVERLAVTTRPDLANHARYPAVHWFTVYGLSRFLSRLGIECFDRFDLIDTTGRSALKRGALWSVLHFAPLRFVGHVLTPGTTVMGIKRPAQ
jgi:2-polyprenyl-6-hydroxyphenyl methylase/3-demethylubiquinone-9 3-methyltransferase